MHSNWVTTRHPIYSHNAMLDMFESSKRSNKNIPMQSSFMEEVSPENGFEAWTKQLCDSYGKL